ncbi:hypothetical protein [Sandarakinorhabdus sp. AAP62]|uniref:hypothetical protein n=1 Tax=Sandarakinorhabdus sp. AAP62 TaxID=1248916 RepID=UPI0002EB454C|nr:hypothetical protein [Sandarakinorhabdus sp. AAP62]
MLAQASIHFAGEDFGQWIALDQRWMLACASMTGAWEAGALQDKRVQESPLPAGGASGFSLLWPVA